MYINIWRFEWDEGKARDNARKHGVGFKEAATAFHDPAALAVEDWDHSRHERRWLLIGESVCGRLLVIVFAMRGDGIRIISARRAGPNERVGYDEDKGIPV